VAFLIYAIDFDGMNEQREALREAHRAHLRAQGSKLLASGALLAEDSRTVIGGMSLLDTDSLEEAERFARDDPYARAGIRKAAQVVRRRQRWLNGKFLGEVGE
jgi:uncharacterized protein YciI